MDALKVMTPEERIGHATEIEDRVREYIVPVLRNSADKGKLERALDEAFDMYMKRYARR